MILTHFHNNLELYTFDKELILLEQDLRNAYTQKQDLMTFEAERIFSFLEFWETLY